MYQYLPCALLKPVPVKPMWHVCCTCLVFILLSSVNLYAQDYTFPQETRYGVRLGADYELPGKNLKDSYRADVNYNAGFMYTHNRYSLEAVASYRKFGAYHGVRRDSSNPANLVTTIISPYTTYLFYISAAYNLIEGEKMNIYAGLNIGACISKSAISYFDNTTNLYLPNTDKQAYVAPKLGLTYSLGNNWHIDARASYNIFTGDSTYTYNTGTGSSGQTVTLSTTIGAGLGLLFKF